MLLAKQVLLLLEVAHLPIGFDKVYFAVFASSKVAMIHAEYAFVAFTIQSDDHSIVFQGFKTKYQT